LVHLVLAQFFHMSYTGVMAESTSRSRQQLRQIGQAQQQQLELLLGEYGPLIRGCFGTRARKCGKPTCRCAQGELHESKYLTASDGDRMRQVHVPAEDEVKVAEGVRRYRRFWGARKKLAELAQRQLAIVDALGRSLLAPYPPDDPIPPARKRGRPRAAARKGPDR
jgi:hypothetical protein